MRRGSIDGFCLVVATLLAAPLTLQAEPSGEAAVAQELAAALALAAAASPAIALAPYGIPNLLAIAGAATLAEAVSPHGWDNATMQVVPTALVWLWMT